MEEPTCRLRSRYAVDLEILRHADAVRAEAHWTRRQTLNRKAEVVICEDKLHAATVCTLGHAAALFVYPYCLDINRSL